MSPGSWSARTLRLVVACLIATLALPFTVTTPVIAADPIAFLTWVRDWANTDDDRHEAWDASTATFNFTGSTAHVMIDVTSASGSRTLEFVAPTGTTLQVGSYAVTSTTAAEASAAMYVAGCWSLGTLDILEAPVVDGSGQVTNFAARFDAQCGGDRVVGVTAVDPSVAVKAVAIDPVDPMEFGSLAIGEMTGPQDLTIKNIGTATVTISGATAVGPNANSFAVDHACSTIAPEATCVVSARFHPASDFAQRAWVAITTDDVAISRKTSVSGGGTFPNIDNATPATAKVVGSLPFYHGGHPPSSSWGNVCGTAGREAWYRYTTSVKRSVRVSPRLPSRPIELLQGTATAMTRVQCGPGGGDLDFTAMPGVTYWIHLGTVYPAEDTALIHITENPPDDAVAIRSIRRTPAAFYPYKDGYLDTVAVLGIRDEPAAIQLRVYNSTNSLVRYLTLPSGAGSFTIKWDGKNKAGSLVPAGPYRLRVTAIDTWGNSTSLDLPVSLSRKRLYTYTYTKALDASAFRASGTSGTGRVSRSASRYTGGVKLTAGSNGGAAVAYNFSVPAATVYKSVRFYALGVSVIPGAGLGLQNWSLCTTFDTSCVDPWDGGPILYGWGYVRGAAKNVSKTRIARGYIDVATYGSGRTWMDVRDVKIVVSYGVLR